MENKRKRTNRAQAQSNYLYFGGLFGEEEAPIKQKGSLIQGSLIPTSKNKHKEALLYGSKWKEKREKERRSRENWELLYPIPKRKITKSSPLYSGKL